MEEEFENLANNINKAFNKDIAYRFIKHQIENEPMLKEWKDLLSRHGHEEEMAIGLVMELMEIAQKHNS